MSLNSERIPVAGRSKTIALVIVLAGAVVGLGANAFAQSDPTPNNKALVGSWLETVTFPPEFGRPPLKSLVTFHGDGTMVNSDQGGVTVDPPLVATPGHGAWRHLRHRRFAYIQRELFSDLNGNLCSALRSHEARPRDRGPSAIDHRGFSRGIDVSTVRAIETREAGASRATARPRRRSTPSVRRACRRQTAGGRRSFRRGRLRTKRCRFWCRRAALRSAQALCMEACRRSNLDRSAKGSWSVL